jgi:hypothetical protein
MSELNGDRYLRPAADAFEHMRHIAFICIAPQSGIGIGDAPFRQHRGGFDGEQRRTRQCQVPEMDKVPVGHAAIDRRVLAHRRDHDAVDEVEPADTERGEQSAHLRSPTAPDRGIRRKLVESRAANAVGMAVSSRDLK